MKPTTGRLVIMLVAALVLCAACSLRSGSSTAGQTSARSEAPPPAPPAPPAAPKPAAPPAGAAPAAKGGIPTKVGDCGETTIKEIGHRLEGVDDSGSSLAFANGLFQVSYDEVAAVHESRVGDKVKVCLVSVPRGCPPGDDRGRVYTTTNLRTGKSWTMPDSSHACGGA